MDKKKNNSYSFSTPDFAFPESVEKNAFKIFQDAMRDKDGIKSLQAVIQVIVAKNLVSHSAFQENVNMLDSAARVLQQPYSSLFTLLEAGMYAQLYNSQSWEFNNRTLPLDFFPEDVNSWSGDLFATKVLQLVDDATSDMNAASSTPLKTLAPVLDGEIYVPFDDLSVADFIVGYSVDLLRNFDPGIMEMTIPFRKNHEKKMLSPKELCSEKITQLLDSRIQIAQADGNLTETAIFVIKKADGLGWEEKQEFLRAWKEKLLASEAVAIIFGAYFDSAYDTVYIGSADSKEFYIEMKEWLGKYSNSPYTAAVKYNLARLAVENVSLNAASNILPGKSVKGTVAVSNVNQMYILIFKVPDSMIRNGSLSVKDFPGASKCVETIPVKFEGSVPFAAKGEFEIPALPVGSYVAVPSISNNLSSAWKDNVDRWSLSYFSVTNITLVTVSNSSMENSGVVYVVDARNQQPIEGAIVTCRDNGNGKVIKTGITDKNGACSMPTGYFMIEARKDGSVTSMWLGNSYHKPTSREELRANILTDLSIYRPGDKVQFSMVGWTAKDFENKLKKNAPVCIVMIDANYNEVDSVSLVTDEWGRCDSSFVLPKDGLLGSYQLVAEFKDNPRQRVGYQRFEVAEYKTPSFYVELQKDSAQSYLPGDLIKFKGIVRTFSGMPMVGANVEFNVRWNPWWRWRSVSSSTASYGGTLTTDEKGEFVIELPTENLKGTPFEWGIYALSASATSPSGETQSAPALRFALGTDLTLHPKITDKTCVEGEIVKFDVPVYDMLNLPVVRDVEYRIINEADTSKILSGLFRSPVLELKASELPSGKYRMEFNLVGDTLTADISTVIFRKNDMKPPYPTPLWVPEKSIIAKEGIKSISVKVGSGYSDSYLLCVVTDKTGILRKEWLRADDNIISVNVPAPDDNNTVWVTFSGLHDFNQDVESVTIESAASQRKMNVITSVFRNKIAAGDHEEWKFTFTVDDDIQKNIPAFAVMSDKALNAIAPFKWNFFGSSFSRGFATDVSYNYVRSFTTSAHFSKMPRYTSIPVYSPTWNTYSYGLANTWGGSGIRLRGNTYMKMASYALTSATKADYATDSVSIGAVMEEAEMEAPAGGAEAGVLGENKVVNMYDGEAANMSDVELRPIDMPLMFFMPRLNSNAEGQVTVAFDVPDFNTTWQFQILGYNEELMSASGVLDAVAAKPVMVRSNPPRFVRTGDIVSITAMLFNNTDSLSDISGCIELFNTDTNEILLKKDFNSEAVAPSGNRTISVEFDVPADLAAFGVRTYALAGKFSDGEQTLVPVLPSSTPVVESTQFYLKTGKQDFSVKLPKFRDNANVTLKYCDNPVWECVLALPSISVPDSKNVFSVLRSLFANSMALHIVNNYPELKIGLENIFASNDTALLTSNLRKDSELKIVSLNNTPWVNDARSETERMQCLDKLLDINAGEAAIKSLVSDLKNLQNYEGGWSWCPGMSASPYITRNVILKLGIMKHSGCLPSDTEEMIRMALKYCDDQAYDSYLKNKKQFSTTDMLSYLYARSFFDVESSNSGFRGLKTKALKSISDEWKGFSIFNKAVAAILMSRSEGYEKTAYVILESLNQYASKDEAKGWWFDNLASGFYGMSKLLTTATALEAYAEIQPGTDAVEGLRQWLVLQKETEDWGSNSYIVEVIGAIMSSGISWTDSSVAASFLIDNNPVDVAAREQLTGLVTLNLDAIKVSGKELKIIKDSSGPVWGGVISQYVAPVKEVKADKSANLKIDKKLLVVKNTSAGAVAKEDEIHVGDKVRVTLTITCDKDMDYVALIDERGAFLEPADQVSCYSFNGGLATYMETRDTKTSFFIEFLPKGVSVVTYDCYADREGEYSVGIASIQSQYSPLQAAHSAGKVVVIK